MKVIPKKYLANVCLLSLQLLMNEEKFKEYTLSNIEWEFNENERPFIEKRMGYIEELYAHKPNFRLDKQIYFNGDAGYVGSWRDVYVFNVLLKLDCELSTSNFNLIRKKIDFKESYFENDILTCVDRHVEICKQKIS